MQEWWQHLPETFHPIAFTVGFFTVYWYAIFFLLGFLAALFLAFKNQSYENNLSKEDIFDLFIVLFFGALIGGRLGYTLLYFPFILKDPLLLLSPYNFTTGEWTGISGMSFHGALIGVVFALLWFAKYKKKNFWKLADIVALVAPIALFFGRLGNFFNGELYGRVTERLWGMYFPDAMPLGVLRHPSALYEALLEGVVLFLILVLFRRLSQFSFPGALSCLFLLGYGILRFLVEFVREPDAGTSLVLGILTRGQFFSGSMIVGGIGLFFWLKAQKRDKLQAKV